MKHLILFLIVVSFPFLVGAQCGGNSSGASSCIKATPDSESVRLSMYYNDVDNDDFVTQWQRREEISGTWGAWVEVLGASTSMVTPLESFENNREYRKLVTRKDGSCPTTVHKTWLFPRVSKTRILANGPTSFCKGSSVTLSTVNDEPTIGKRYSWFKNGVGMGVYTESVTVTESGNYYVSLSENNRSCYVPSKDITVNVTFAESNYTYISYLQFKDTVKLESGFDITALNFTHPNATASIFNGKLVFTSTVEGIFSIDYTAGNDCTGGTINIVRRSIDFSLENPCSFNPSLIADIYDYSLDFAWDFSDDGINWSPIVGEKNIVPSKKTGYYRLTLSRDSNSIKSDPIQLHVKKTQINNLDFYNVSIL